MNFRRFFHTSKKFFTKDIRSSPRKPRRWLKWTSILTVALGGSYIGNMVFNDDTDVITDLFRTKLSEEERKNRPKLVILGSGWGALSTLRKIHGDKFNITVISPRNYFLFTPLLPSTTTGTVSVRSIIEPVRYYLKRSGADARFIEMEATSINPHSKTIHCIDVSEVKGKVSEIDIDYDYLIVAVGAETATFNIPGVKEHSIFMRSIADSQMLKQRVIDCFETSTIPGQPDNEIDRLLHFVIVGGGPAGVECTAELFDFIKHDLRKAFPEVANRVKISLLEAMPQILPSFDRTLVEYVVKKFRESRSINVLTQSMVTEIKEDYIVIKETNGNIRHIPYGFLLWVAGNAPRPIVKDLMRKLGKEYQPNPRGLNINGHLKVKGTNDIFAIGDASASTFAPTAQVASQQGYYLARLMNKFSEELHQDINNRKQGLSTNLVDSKLNDLNKFDYKHWGSLAYVGDNRAIAELKYANVKSSGLLTFMFWRSVYVSKLLSTRNRLYVLNDWLRAAIFGRDISRG